MLFNRIVVGVDGADGGRDAIALAKLLATDSADIVLLNAFAYETSPSRGSLGGYAEVMSEEAQSMVEAAGSDDARCRTRVVADWSAGRAIHQAAAEEHADLIVVGSAHHGPVGRLLLGDVSRNTLHGAPCAVAVAPRGFHERSHASITTIGVGVDGTNESDAALAVARDLAANSGASLRLLTAIQTPVAFAPAYAYAYDWTELEADNRKFAEEHLAEVKASLAVPAETVVVSSGAAIALEELSESVDVIVAGSRGWGTAKAVVLGSTTDRLVHNAHCPVIVVPSPVTAAKAEEAVDA